MPLYLEPLMLKLYSRFTVKNDEARDTSIEIIYNKYVNIY